MIPLAAGLAAATVAASWAALQSTCGVGLRPRRVAEQITPAAEPNRTRPRVLRNVHASGAARRVSLVAGVLALATIALADPFVAVLGGVALAAYRPLVRRLQSHRRAQLLEQQQPAAIELLVLLVRSGLTPHQAVRRMVDHVPGPTGAGFAAVVAGLDVGDRLADALAVLPRTLGPGYTALADALALAERYGLPLEPTLERLAGEVRNTRRRLAEADARRLPIKLAFPLVMCSLPSFVLMAIAPAAIAAIRTLDTSPF